MREHAPGEYTGLSAALHKASELLPSQAILENFVHHNPLHHFEDLPFHTAIAQAAKQTGIAGYASERYFEEKLQAGAITEDALTRVIERHFSSLTPLPGSFAAKPLQALINLFAGPHRPHQRATLRDAIHPRLPAMPALPPRYDPPAARIALASGFDPRPRVAEALSELAQAFLDRGAAAWVVPNRHQGFVRFFANLETVGNAAWRSFARERARALLRGKLRGEDELRTIFESWSIAEADTEDALRALLFELPGWAGMFLRMESEPAEAPARSAPRLMDYVIVAAILTQSSLYASMSQAVRDTTNLRDWLRSLPTLEHQRRGAAETARINDVVRLYERNGLDAKAVGRLLDSDIHAAAELMAILDDRRRRIIWLEALERSYTIQVATGLSLAAAEPEASHDRPTLHVFTCIDDREESLRRYIEAEVPGSETFGIAGFYGLAVRYTPIDGRDPMTLCPLGVVPSQAIVEAMHPDDHVHFETWRARRKLGGRVIGALQRASRMPLHSAIVATALGPFILVRFFLETIAPHWFNHMRRAFLDAVARPGRTKLEATHTPEDAAKLLAVTFHTIGLRNNMAPLVVVLGHGSQSSNNPYFAAYDCGACSGRHGGPNGRLFAKLANSKEVRALLAGVHGIHVPDSTHFIGGIHNTAADSIEIFDRDEVPSSHHDALARAQQAFERVCARNAYERCRRFLLADVANERDAWAHVRLRSENAAEVRPELNHATNASVLIGRRSLSRHLFLDRRTFLVSYDPTVDDANGTGLERVIAPALIVCSGINLEYFFSTTDPDTMGAGSKAPLNVVGQVGVVQGAFGDLRSGLPIQMTEMHTPMRALFVVDAPVERVRTVLARRPDLAKLVDNAWVNMMVRNPDTGALTIFDGGSFVCFDDPMVTLPRPEALHNWFAGNAHDLPVAFIPAAEVA